jgi:hypothetical protein
MPETGPMWLTRVEDVVSHLYFAAAEIGSATMEFGSFQVPGSLSFPNPEQRTFSFFTHGEVDISLNPISEGDVVRFHYSQGDATYTFISSVEDISDQAARRRWRILFPNVVERDQRRLVRRHRVMGRQGFFFSTLRVGRGHQQMALYDVATAGISLVFEAHEGFKVGDEFEGKVQVPGCEPFSAYLEVRNVRPLPGDAKRKLAGCRFVGLGSSDQEALAQALAKLN